MEYRLGKGELLDVLSAWDSFLKRKVHLIACGGTALTLLDVKPSTKDIDLIVPNEQEYGYLLSLLGQLGYKKVTGSGWAKESGFVFGLFTGKRVHTTELLESPLEGGNNILIREFAHTYLGALNCYDLIISKVFRGSSVDIDDCVLLVKARMKEIDLKKLVSRYKENRFVRC